MIDHLRNPFTQDLEAVCRSQGHYQTAEPFPHCYIDGLISEKLLEEVLGEFPEPGRRVAKDEVNRKGGLSSSDPPWIELNEEDKSQKKLISADADKHLGFHTKHLASVLNSSAFISFLERLTGIDGLIPDPHLYAGGLHQIESGGFLALHTDFHWSEKLRLYRRINVILYLNKDWSEEYKGHLELWDKKLESCVKLLPSLNRMVISNIGPHTYHGLPQAILCPTDMTRKSLAIWYYTRELPPEVKLQYVLNEPHWAGQSAPGRSRVRSVAKKIIPPFIQDLARKSPRHLLYEITPPIVMSLFGREKG